MDRSINHRGHRGKQIKRKSHTKKVGLLVTCLAVLSFLCVLCGSNTGAQNKTPLSHSINPEPGEKHLRNIRQLTFGGENAEAYFSADGKRLIFQATREGHGCDLIYTMNVDGSDVRLISNEKGRTTCAFFFPNGKRVLYSSTHLASRDCPPDRKSTRLNSSHSSPSRMPSSA